VDTRKIVFPAIFLITAVSITIVYQLSFQIRESGLDTITFYFAIGLVAFTLLVLFQKFIDNKVLHIPLSIGWGLIFTAAIEKLNAEMLDTQSIENETFFTALFFFGLVFVSFGLYFWTRQMWENQRRSLQQHRVIELYTSLMSHDAGNDLQAILGYVEASLMDPEDYNPKTLRMLEGARAATLRMAGLIKAFRPEELDTEQSLVPLLKSTAIQAEKADYRLKTKFFAQPGTENAKVAGASLLQVALANLLRNAAQHAGDNPLVDIKIFRKSEDLIVTISDGGPGISDDLKKVIFDRGGSDSDHGLGLYLTKQIILACSGTIEIVDSPVGASFKIVLPIAE
jgi:signal transduction histidine kinase